MLTYADGWDFAGSRHSKQCFRVDAQERGSLYRTEERFEGGVGNGPGDWWWGSSGVDLISHGN
jgi:hypothetical protein